MKAFVGAVALAAFAACVTTAIAQVAAKIDTGSLTGVAQDQLVVYKAIPYAAPPIGSLRWAPPRKPAAWAGVRTADTFSAICPQPLKADGSANTGGASGRASEDCLYLNIWAPKAAKSAPVMVWLHGGGNTTGSGAIGAYDGGAFARDGVILVTINYRLGALGFFAHPALTKAAKTDEPLINYGVMDQIAALQWVKRNIAAFGGDPAKVTVFGESAGGADTLLLLATPKAKGLFAGAIVESGLGWGEPRTLAQREAEGDAFVQGLGAPKGATLEQLRALSADALTSKYLDSPGVGVDGRMLTQTPAQAFAHGKALNVPLIIGSNSYEASLRNTIKISTEASLAAAPATLKAAYANEKTDADKADALFTDGVMGAPAHWIAGQAKAPVWLYHFPYVLALQRGFLKGTPHAFEIPYVFDSWDHLGALAMGFKPDGEAAGVTRMVHACWVGFAKTGAPVCADGQAWPAFTPTNDTLLRFEAKPVLISHFRQAYYQAQEAAKLPGLGLDAK